MKKHEYAVHTVHTAELEQSLDVSLTFIINQVVILMLTLNRNLLCLEQNLPFLFSEVQAQNLCHKEIVQQGWLTGKTE